MVEEDRAKKTLDASKQAAKGKENIATDDPAVQAAGQVDQAEGSATKNTDGAKGDVGKFVDATKRN